MSGKYVMYYPVSKVEVNLEYMRDFVYKHLRGYLHTIAAESYRGKDIVIPV